MLEQAMPGLGDRSFHPRVRYRKDVPCSLKRHTSGCLRQVIGYLEKLAANDPDRVVWASAADIHAHCKKGHNGTGGLYGKRHVLRALNLAEDLGLVELVVRNGRVARIISDHNAVHSVEGGECVLYPWSIGTPGRERGQTRSAQLLAVDPGKQKSSPMSSPMSSQMSSGALPNVISNVISDVISNDGQVVHPAGANATAAAPTGCGDGGDLEALTLKPLSPSTRQLGYRGLFGVFSNGSNEDNSQPFPPRTSHSNGAQCSPVPTATDDVIPSQISSTQMNIKEGDIPADGGAGEDVAVAAD